MKKNVYKLLLNLFLGIVCFELQAQTMYVKPSSGSEATYSINTLRKLTFSGDNILVTSLNGALVTHSKSGNRYIKFNDLTLATSTPQIGIKVFDVYPNPAQDVLNILMSDGVQNIDNIQVFTLDGRMVIQQMKVNTSAPQVMVNTLPKGIYLCKITSGNTIKTIKFLKQ